MERAAPRLQLLKIAGLRGPTPPRPRRGRPREGGRRRRGGARREPARRPLQASSAGLGPQGADARLCSGPGESQVHIPGPGSGAARWRPRWPLGTGQPRLPGRPRAGGPACADPGEDERPARTPALPPQSRSAACAACRWLSIPICILGFHGTFSVVLFTSVFSGGADGPLFR